MNDFVQNMIDAADQCSTLPLLNLLREYDPSCNNQLFIFLEGKTDLTFYKSKLNPVIESNNCNAFFEICGDKDSVRSLFRLTKSRNFYDQRRLYFFVDRDLSPMLEEQQIEDQILVEADNVYITENYSYENDILTTKTYKDSIMQYSSLDELIDKNAIEKAVYDYEFVLNKFINMMQPVMSTLIFWKLNGIQNKGVKKFHIKKFLTISGNTIKWNEDIIAKMYNDCCANMGDHDANVVREIESEINRRGLKSKITRGHWLVEFFCKYWNGVRFEVERKGKPTYLPLHTMDEYIFNNGITSIAESPTTLKRFIRDTIAYNCKLLTA